MFGDSAAHSRPHRRAWNLLIALQVVLLLFSLVGPAVALAADPSADPNPSESAPPSADPTASPDPSPAPLVTPDPSAAPSADPTPAPTPDSTPAPTPAATPDSTPAPSYAPYIVTFVAGTSAADQGAALAAAGAIDLDSIAVLRMHAVDATEAGADALRADARVAQVEADRSRAVEATPDDPSYPDQWSLPRIGWDQAHDSITPTGSAVVAVLDTGVDATHPDLDSNVVTGASFVVGSPWDADSNGHGTAMAGIVAAETGNGTGVAGVGYAGVRVMPVTVLGPNGLGRDSDIIEGLVWATDHGADVALMAFSASGYSAALQAAVDYAWSRGVVVVAATGNDGSSVAAFPAGDRGVVGVSSTDSSDALSSSSNYGADTFLAAPGEGILTTATGGGVASVSGTSASAAAVAGAAALLRAADPSLSAGAVVGRLARNADAAGTAEQTGNGRLNLFRALSDAATDSVAPLGAAPVGSGGPFVGPYVAALIHVQGVSVGAQSPSSVSAGGTATYVVSVNMNGSGSNVGALLDISSGLPPGVTATFSTGASCRSSNNVDWMSTLTLTTTNGTTPAATTSFTVRAREFASSTCSGSAADTLTATGSLVVTAPSNSAPTATNLSAGETYTEDTALNLTDIVISDVDSANVTATLTLSNPAAGSLNTGTSGSVTSTYVSGTGTWTAFGPIADVNTLLAGLTFTPALNFNSNFSIATSVSDGVAAAITGTKPMTGVAVNDAPLCTSPQSGSTNEDQALNSSVVCTDVDGDTLTYSRVADATHGSVTVNVSGTFSYSPNADFNGSDSFTFRVNDGAADSNVATYNVTVVAVNDAPVDTVPGSQTTAEDTLLVFSGGNGNQISVSDVDGSTIQVTLSATNGALTLGSVSGLTFSFSDVNGTGAGDGTADATMTFRGTVSDVNASIATITFAPTADFHGAASLSILSNDLGNTGSGGAKTDLEAVSINVTAVNDAPVITDVSLSSASINEGQSTTVTAAFTDADAGDGHSCTFAWGDGTSPTTVTAGPTSCSASHTYLDDPIVTPDTFEIDVTVSDDGTTDGSPDPKSDTESALVTVNNVAPTVVIDSGTTTVNEGDAATSYTYHFTDPGTDTWTHGVSCGATGVVSADSFDQTTKSGSFKCAWADDDPTNTASDTETVGITVSDDDLGSDTETRDVTVSNVAPTVTIDSGVITVNEGDAATTYSYHWTDPGTDTWSRVTSCGATGVKSSEAFDQTTKTGSFKCAWADDAPTGTASDPETVSIQVSDDDLGSDTETRDVTVNNVAPTVTSVTIGWDPFTHVATGTATFTDVGTQDTHTASFLWTVNGTAQPATPGTVVETDGSGSATSSLALSPGCYTLGADVTIMDDDTGVGSNSGSGSSLDAYAVQFRAPIKDDVRNIAKAGSTIPVKVVINKFCGGGGTVTNVDLYLTIAAGAAANEVADDLPNLIQDAGSSNDNGLKFRIADGGYIYNFSTKGLNNTSDYTLRVRLGSAGGPIIKTAVIRTQK